jgi:hypothetical protein
LLFCVHCALALSLHNKYGAFEYGLAYPPNE